MVFFNRIFLLRFLFRFFLLIAITSCSANSFNNNNNYVIKYINLNVVYEYIYNNSNEAQELKRKIDSLNKKIFEAENSNAQSELNY
jgi:Skp family chaperone for outer membrane proteins